MKSTLYLDHLNIIKSSLSICFCIHTCFMKSRHAQEGQVLHDNIKQGKIFDHVENYSLCGDENRFIVSDLDGTLTREKSSFSYFMLVAFEAGSPLRGLILLLFYPLIWCLHSIISESAAIHMLIFISLVGLKASDVVGVGRAVLCRFYLEDLHSQSYRAFLSCGKRCVVTANPRLMVEPFLKEYVEVGHVIGTELHTLKGYCTGFVSGPGVLVGKKKADAVRETFKDKQPDVGLGSNPGDYGFLTLCKQAYLIDPKKQEKPVAREHYLKPLIFHDGRLVMRPTPLAILVIYLWFPVGFVLAIVRIMIYIMLPLEVAVPMLALCGVHVRVKGSPEAAPAAALQGEVMSNGKLYVCTHRTLLDPVFLSGALRRRVTALTYSLSRVSEIISPIRTVRLTRRRSEDARTIRKLLQQGDAIVCPEGTTCREPYLLRFSYLFAELSDDIVPVALDVQVSMFHGSTARGFKGMDSFYFFINPRPHYSITLLDPLPPEHTCAGGRSSAQVANHVQQLLATVMGFHCTNLTRRDKYRILVDNDGLTT